MKKNGETNKKCLKCVHYKVCEYIDDGIQMCCSGYDGCDFFEEKESRINLSERIKLVNNARRKTISEFSERLLKEAEPHPTKNDLYIVGLDKIEKISKETIRDLDKMRVIE